MAGQQIQTSVGLQNNGQGATPNGLRQGNTGELIVGDGHGRYYETTYRGRTFYLNLTNGAVSNYLGGAGGSPLLAIHNPANSGVNLVLIGAAVGLHASASAAGVCAFNLWGGPSVLPTGTRTNPVNLLSLAASGSAAAGFVNTALTGSTALAQIMPIGSYYWATAASALLAPINFDAGGQIIIIPGNQLALGGTNNLTSATWHATLIWEEVTI